MAFYSNMIPMLLGVYDEEISVWHYAPSAVGSVLGRDSLNNVHHSGGNPVLHPTLPFIMKNTNGHVFLNGTFKFEWKWEENEFTEDQIDQYIELATPFLVNPNSVYIKDIPNRTLTLITEDANIEFPDWTGQTMPWHPATSKAQITTQSVDAEFLCVTRLNGTFDQYTFEQRTIEPGESLEIIRPVCDVCYVLFTDHVLKGTDVLISKKMYKMRSDSLTVTNNQQTRIRVLRYYR